MIGPARLRSSAGPSIPHPLVLRRRFDDLLIVGLGALIPALTAIAITIGLPGLNLFVVLAAIAGLIGVIVLMVSTRLEVTVALVIIYLGLINGPVKMFFGARELTASLQDVVILAVAAGALMRILVRREKIRLPELSGLVIAWVVLVVANAFNPRTENLLHIAGGFRQELQYVPFFFFGYVLMRSKDRFRKLFILFGVIALLNGVVAAYQTTLSPNQLASWGPGYAALIHPSEGTGSGRVFFTEGEAHVRPPGLGSDAGFSGAVGHIALPMCLALLVLSTGRKRWFAALLCLGAAVAVMVGLGRLATIGAALGVVVFMGLVALSGRRFTNTMLALLGVLLLMIPVGAVLVSTLNKGTFSRFETLSTGSSTTLHKESSWDKIPKYAEAAPFGFGLGNSGPVGGLGGKSDDLLEGHGLTSETQYNVLIKELGVPGLLLWPAMVVYVSLIVAMGMRRIKDPDLAVCLAGALAAFPPLLIEGTTGFLGGSTIDGPYFFFAIGVAGYWFAGPGRRLAAGKLRKQGDDRALAVA
ncbi:MAG: hypothetical protein ACLQBB_15055 [Solirubrobacteraceae bacterium]